MGAFMNSKNTKSQFTIEIKENTTHITPGHTAEKPKQPSVSWFFIGSAGQIGFAILVPLLLGIAIGIFIDSKLATKPTGVLVGMCIGIILSVINLVRTVKEIIHSQPN